MRCRFNLSVAVFVGVRGEGNCPWLAALSGVGDRPLLRPKVLIKSLRKEGKHSSVDFNLIDWRTCDWFALDNGRVSCRLLNVTSVRLKFPRFLHLDISRQRCVQYFMDIYLRHDRFSTVSSFLLLFKLNVLTDWCEQSTFYKLIYHNFFWTFENFFLSKVNKSLFINWIVWHLKLILKIFIVLIKTHPQKLIFFFERSNAFSSRALYHDH